MAAASHHGLSLEVDFDFFDRLEIYSRGEVIDNSAAQKLEAVLPRAKKYTCPSIRGW